MGQRNRKIKLRPKRKRLRRKRQRFWLTSRLSWQGVGRGGKRRRERGSGRSDWICTPIPSGKVLDPDPVFLKDGTETNTI